MACAVGSGV